MVTASAQASSSVAMPKTSPSVFPLSLCSGTQDGNVVIGCLVHGFFPSSPIEVIWNHSGAGGTVRQFPAVAANTEGLYTTSSQLTLPAAQCPDRNSIQCRVKQDPNAEKVVNVPCKGECPIPCQQCSPRLSLQKPALEDLLLGSEANLTCTLSGLRDPQGATFTWKPSGGKDAVQGSPEKDICGCYKVSSVLPGCADPWNRGETFTCSVTHPEVKDGLHTTISKNIGHKFRPQVHLLPPPSEELALNELVTLTCVVRGYSPKEVLVRWLHENQELPKEDYITWPSLQEPSQGVDTYTYSVTSTLRVSAEIWKQGDNFSCMVGHEALPLAFTQKTIDHLAGKPTHVNVSVVVSEVDGTCY